MKKHNAAAFAFALIIPAAAAAQQSASRVQPVVAPQKTPASQMSQNEAVRTPQQEAELRADILMARKEYSDAITVYLQLLQQEPRNAILLNKVGIAYHQLTELGRAQRYYERSVKADKNYASAINNLGALLYDRRRYRKAIDQYKKALAISPNMATFYRNLGSAYLAEKKYEEAFAAYHRALELDPDVFENRGGFGTVLQHIGVDDKGMYYFLMAKMYASLGNAEHCALYLRKSRDEGYKNLASAKTDPAFAGVLSDPTIQEILQPPVENKPQSSPPGALI